MRDPLVSERNDDRFGVTTNDQLNDDAKRTLIRFESNCQSKSRPAA